MNFKFFCGSDHLWAYNHVDASCVMTSSNKKIFVCVNAECFCLFGKLLLTWISGFFMEATIYEPIIMLMPLVWWRHQSKKIFVCVNVECFCLIGKLLLTWISGFFMEATIYEPIIMLIPLAWWRRQSKKILFV